MADIQCFYCIRHCQSHIYILIGVTAYMEVARYFLHSEAAPQSASVLIFKCLFCHLILLHLIGFSQQFEIT